MGLSEIHQDKAVRGPDVGGGLGIGEKHHVRGLEQLGAALELGAGDHSILELLGKGKEVLGVLGLGARDVNADNGLLVVQVCHIQHAALKDNGVVLQNQVACEA